MKTDDAQDIPKASEAPDPLRQITGWIIAGHSEADIIDAIGKTWPDTKAKPLIVKAIAQIGKSGEPDAKLMRGFCIESTREIYRKALEVADHATALRALKQLAELSR